jgi:hypothetical protein
MLLQLPALALLLAVGATAMAPHEDVANHYAQGSSPGPLVVLIRHGFSDHNVLMQKV